MRLMDTLRKEIEEINNSLDKIFKNAVSENKNILFDYVAVDQLKEKGIDGFGKKIIDREPYSPITISIKRLKGQPTNRVTLEDTGDWKDSFYIKYYQDGFEIESKDWKSGKLLDRYGDEVLDIADYNLQDFLDFYLMPALYERLKVSP